MQCSLHTEYSKSHDREIRPCVTPQSAWRQASKVRGQTPLSQDQLMSSSVNTLNFL